MLRQVTAPRLASVAACGDNGRELALGDGAFAPQQVYSALGNGGFDLAAYDIDADRQLDVLTNSNREYLMVLGGQCVQ
jgi:hypothetical protein